MSWIDTVERLSQYDKTKYPPGSPNVAVSKKESAQKKLVTAAELDSIIERLSKYDAVKYPPNSSLYRNDLKLNRYNYDQRSAPDVSGIEKKMDKYMIEAMVERLRIETKPRHVRQLSVSDDGIKTYTAGDVDEIFQRLQKCDYKDGPPESSMERTDLGYYRYSYTKQHSTNMYQAPKVPKEKVNEIVQRLSTYDINKYPPGSRGHEKL